MTYRQIATIARCSSGAVSAELRALKAEKKKTEDQSYSKNTPVISTSSIAPVLQSNTKEIELDIEDVKIELDFAS